MPKAAATKGKRGFQPASEQEIKDKYLAIGWRHISGPIYLKSKHKKPDSYPPEDTVWECIFTNHRVNVHTLEMFKRLPMGSPTYTKWSQKELHRACGGPGCNAADGADNRNAQSTRDAATAHSFQTNYSDMVARGWSLSADDIAAIQNGSKHFNTHEPCDWIHDICGMTQTARCLNLKVKIDNLDHAELHLSANLAAQGLRGCDHCEETAIGLSHGNAPMFYRTDSRAGYFPLRDVIRLQLDERYPDRDGRFFDYTEVYYVAGTGTNNGGMLHNIRCSEHGVFNASATRLLGIQGANDRILVPCSRCDLVLNPRHHDTLFQQVDQAFRAKYHDRNPLPADSDLIKNYIRFQGADEIGTVPGGVDLYLDTEFDFLGRSADITLDAVSEIGVIDRHGNTVIDAKRSNGLENIDPAETQMMSNCCNTLPPGRYKVGYWGSANDVAILKLGSHQRTDLFFEFFNLLTPAKRAFPIGIVRSRKLGLLWADLGLGDPTGPDWHHALVDASAMRAIDMCLHDILSTEPTQNVGFNDLLDAVRIPSAESTSLDPMDS